MSEKPPEGTPPPDYILQFFQFEHLPKELAEISRPFCYMAKDLVNVLPRNPERTVALRKLLEAKDAAVRALWAKPVDVDIARNSKPVDVETVRK